MEAADYFSLYALRRLRRAVVLATLVCLWYIVRLWWKGELYGLQLRVFVVWFAAALAVQFASHRVSVSIADSSRRSLLPSYWCSSISGAISCEDATGRVTAVRLPFVSYVYGVSRLSASVVPMPPLSIDRDFHFGLLPCAARSRVQGVPSRVTGRRASGRQPWTWKSPAQIIPDARAPAADTREETLKANKAGTGRTMM